jgi:hypothetical protein
MRTIIISLVTLVGSFLFCGFYEFIRMADGDRHESERRIIFRLVSLTLILWAFSCGTLV